MPTTEGHLPHAHLAVNEHLPLLRLGLFHERDGVCEELPDVRTGLVVQRTLDVLRTHKTLRAIRTKSRQAFDVGLRHCRSTQTHLARHGNQKNAVGKTYVHRLVALEHALTDGGRVHNVVDAKVVEHFAVLGGVPRPEEQEVR